MATIHPSAIIQRKRISGQQAMGMRMVPALDIKRVVSALTKGRKLATAPFVIGPPPWRNEPFVFDIETRSKKDRRVEWIGIQHSEEMGSEVYGGPWTMMRGWVEREMRGAALKVGQNIIGFDIPALAAEGVTIREPFWDTMIVAGTCEGDMPRGLFYQQAYYAGHRSPFHKELTPSGSDTEPIEVKLRRTRALRAAWKETGIANGIEMEGDWEAFYNARDVIATGIVYRAQRERARGEGWV